MCHFCFFNDTSTTEIYTYGHTLSLHDALPIFSHASLLQVARDPNVNAVLYPIPMEYGDTTLAACTDMVRVQAEVDKPIIPVWMSDKTGTGYDALVQQELVPFRSLSRAIKAISRWNQYGRWRAGFDSSWKPALKASAETGESAQDYQTYTEREAKSMLARAGVRVPTGGVAATLEEALHLSAGIEGPVVAKIVSQDILPKSDIGGENGRATCRARVCQRG